MTPLSSPLLGGKDGGRETPSKQPTFYHSTKTLMIELKNINKSYGTLKVVQDFSLTIPAREITVLVVSRLYTMSAQAP